MTTERPIDIFAKRLDEIFEMGDPTKSLIYDAFHKATETLILPQPNQLILEEAAWEGFKRCMRFFAIDDQDKQMRRAFEIWWKQLPANHKLFN